jgi:hypothetical protein
MFKPTLRTVVLATAIAATGLSGLFSCKKDDDNTVTVASATTGGKDLSGATAATNVGLTSNVVIKFSKAVDAATATAASVTLTAAGITGNVPAAITAAGDSIVLNPTNDLLSGTKYTLSLASTIKSKDGGTFAAKTFTFTTFGPANIVPPKAGNQIAYFPFNGTFNDNTGTYTTSATIATTFGADRKGNAGAAAEFNGTTSIVEVANGTNLITTSGTVSFWVKADTSGRKGLFVMGANFFKGHQFEISGNGEWIKSGANFQSGADNTTEDLFYNANGQYNTTGGWQGHTFKKTEVLKNVLPGKWAHVVHTYDAATKVRSLYINGDLAMSSDFNLWPAGDSKLLVSGMKTQVAADLSTTWAFGFSKARDASFWEDTDFGAYSKPGANHFKGSIDDVRFFNAAMTRAEAIQLYNLEK